MDGASAAPPNLPTLRFLTCGSVDDGKSTLIGRLLFEQKLILDDQLAALKRDSEKHGTTGGGIDFALLVDGLEAEREQGITIDVAYRYFATPRRSFIVADTPGHEQYTRNMATGASNAEFAVILVDARKGLLPQTFRHSFIVSLLGIRHIALAINKIDLVGFDERVFNHLVAEFEAFAAPLAFKSITAIPLSAREGDNVAARSPRMPWYKGPTLVECLDTIVVEDGRERAPARFPVQWVNRPNADFRGYAGTLASGVLRRGDEVVVAVSGAAARIASILLPEGEREEARAADALTLTLDRELDIARGDLLTRPDERPQVADQFAATLIWMSEERLLPGRSYLMKIGTRTVPATVSELKHRIDVHTFDKLASKTLSLNEIGVCNLSTSAPVAFDPYAENR
jgi:bifunctional enzyme CysN/CysC